MERNVWHTDYNSNEENRILGKKGADDITYLQERITSRKIEQVFDIHSNQQLNTSLNLTDLHKHETQFFTFLFY